MNYDLLNALAITVLALAGLWVFGKSRVNHGKEDTRTSDEKKE